MRETEKEREVVIEGSGKGFLPYFFFFLELSEWEWSVERFRLVERKCIEFTSQFHHFVGILDILVMERIHAFKTVESTIAASGDRRGRRRRRVEIYIYREREREGYMHG